MVEITWVKAIGGTDQKTGRKTECQAFRVGRYEVDQTTVTFVDGESYTIIRVAGDWNERYLPEIYYCDGPMYEKAHFRIQTTSYGWLEPEEIKEVIAKYQEAVEVVEVLTKEFCR